MIASHGAYITFIFYFLFWGDSISVKLVFVRLKLATGLGIDQF